MSEILYAVFFAAGFALARFGEKRKRAEVKDEKAPQSDDNPSVTFGDTSPYTGEAVFNQMMLRNGYGVTRDRNPTFAEQWVNIMNYSGESQTEDGYEEESDNTEGYLE